MGRLARGRLVIIGGAEDKEGDCIILRQVVDMAGGKEARLVVITTASQNPEKTGLEYARLFRRLGAGSTDIVTITNRAEANDPDRAERVSRATGLFFTGGDQLRITSTLGGTRVDDCLHRAYENGAVVAGTSAGASAMSNTMIVEGINEDAPKKCTTKMSPGLGLLEEVVIDQHFAQRGRIGRLLSALAQNPYILAVGIDEDTAMIVTPDDRFQVIGSQTVTVLDGRKIGYSNASELQPNEPLALTGVTLHVLPAGYGFDLLGRKPD